MPDLKATIQKLIKQTRQGTRRWQETYEIGGFVTAFPEGTSFKLLEKDGQHLLGAKDIHLVSIPELSFSPAARRQDQDGIESALAELYAEAEKTAVHLDLSPAHPGGY